MFICFQTGNSRIKATNLILKFKFVKLKLKFKFKVENWVLREMKIITNYIFQSGSSTRASLLLLLLLRFPLNKKIWIQKILFIHLIKSHLLFPRNTRRNVVHLNLPPLIFFQLAPIFRQELIAYMWQAYELERRPQNRLGIREGEARVELDKGKGKGGSWVMTGG